jgi:hypothetical protein
MISFLEMMWSRRSRQAPSDSLTFKTDSVIEVTSDDSYESDKDKNRPIQTAVIVTAIAADIEEQKNRAASVTSAQGYPCVYCNGFESKYQEDYERHVLTKHPDHLPCPTENDLWLNGGRIKRGRK